MGRIDKQQDNTEIHEILLETNHEEIFRDVLNWINEKLKKIG